MNLSEITNLIEAQGADISEKFSAIQREVDDLQARAGRPFAGTTAPVASPRETWIDAKSGELVPVLRHGELLAASAGQHGSPSLGRLLRGICLGGSAPDAAELEAERKSLNIGSDPSGGYTVAGTLADQWIDALRAKMVLSSAGAITLPMDAGQVSIARVTGDPTVSWHGENVALPEAEPTFGKVTLNAKTCVCLVKLSLELAQDSANIEQQLQNVIVNAMAAAIDSAGINGSTTNAGAAPSGLVNLTGRNTVTGIGAPVAWDFLIDGMYELALDNVPMESIGALVAHPAVWKKMRKLKTGITNDNTPLPTPAEVAALPKLWTTAAPLDSGTTATAIIANWRDLVFGVRKQITVRVLTESFFGSNLQLGIVAYARVDFAAARAASFCTLEGITV